jgi:hypothetical protein
LPSGPELNLEIIHHEHGNDRWMASLTLTTSFQALDIETAEEMALDAMGMVLEHALHDLKGLADKI